jgi:hypothetical protein
LARNLWAAAVLLCAVDLRPLVEGRSKVTVMVILSLEKVKLSLETEPAERAIVKMHVTCAAQAAYKTGDR